jgi:hypothetical protein
MLVNGNPFPRNTARDTITDYETVILKDDTIQTQREPFVFNDELTEEDIHLDSVKDQLFSINRMQIQILRQLEHVMVENAQIKSMLKGEREITVLKEATTSQILTGLFYRQISENHREELNEILKYSHYKNAAAKACSGRWGATISATAVSGALTGGCSGAVAGASLGSIPLPIIGTLAGTIILGSLGTVAGAITGILLGAGASTSFTVVDFSGWKDMKIYECYHREVKQKLMEEPELQKFICQETHTLMWEPYSIQTWDKKEDHFNRSGLEKRLSELVVEEHPKPKEQFYTVRLKSSLKTDLFDDVPLEMYDYQSKKEDRAFHKQMYKTLLEVAERHKLAFEDANLKRALDLVVETYHPRYYGKNPDDISFDEDVNTFWRWFLTYKHYKVSNLNQEDSHLDNEVANSKQKYRISKMRNDSDDVEIKKWDAIKHMFLSCMGK